MGVKEWEPIIQKMVDECSLEQTRVDTLLLSWRSKLEKEPTLLQPFQIDEIVREVQRRLRPPADDTAERS